VVEGNKIYSILFYSKEESKKQYSRILSQFPDFVPEHDFELAHPAEDSFSLFFNFLL
jgi:hypothetical protein